MHQIYLCTTRSVGIIDIFDLLTWLKPLRTTGRLVKRMRYQILNQSEISLEWLYNP